MTSALEDIKTIDLEEWLTLATAPAPTKLKQGQTPNMKNCWVDEKPGSVITAPGYVKVGQIPSGNPVSFCINYFKTSSGTQTFVVSDNLTVWTTVDFQNFTSIITGLSSSFQLRGAIIRDKLWLTNGSDAVRTFDGTTVVVLSGSAGTLILQDLTYSSAGTLYSPSSITVAYTGGATAGAEVVTVTGPAISVQIQTGVSTATQVQTAINASVAALALVSVVISGTAGHAQVTVAATALSGGTPNVPRGRYIAYHDERVWLFHISTNRSACYFSALTDAAANIINPDDVSAWPTQDFLQVSQGDADFGTGLLLYRGYLFFFKQYSIWRLVGYDEYTYSRVKTRSSTGTRFSESLQILDSLIHLIGVDGLYVFDGEESDRISDIIDPATASQTAFGFNQLQQPNTNSQFWEVTASADWSAGTVPTDLVVNNSITVEAADDSQADFQAGATQTNLDLVTTPGTLQLSVTSSGHSNTNVALGLGGSIVAIANTGTLGVGTYITDGNTSNLFGFSGSPSISQGVINVNSPISSTRVVTTVILRGVFSGNATMVLKSGGITITPTAVSASATLSGSNINFPPVSAATDYTITIPAQTMTDLQLVLTAINSNTSFTLYEVEVYTASFNTTGSFTSKTLDLGITPVSLGEFNATETLNTETTAYFTQSSANGSSWDAPVSVTNGGSIGSTPRRYLRWGVNITSDGFSTPFIDAAYLPAVYISAIHNTGGSIFAWGPFESDYSALGQTLNFYYRTATTSGGITAATWNLIVPGGVLSDPVANQYVQFKIEISGGLSTNLPVVSSVTINWVVGNGIQAQTLQNVASTYWRNRYWLSAASASSTSNDTILIRGKKTFASPWMLKDWAMLSFTRFQDSLYGGSSIDGSLFLLDSGYSKAGTAMDSYFETGDFVFAGFTANFIELDVEVERLGSWNISVGYSVDGGNTFTELTIPLTTSTYDGNFIKRLNINVTTTRIRFRFRTNGIDTPFQVHRAVAYYKLEVERGSIRGDYISA